MTAGKTTITLYTCKPRKSVCILSTVHPNVRISIDRYVGLQNAIHPTCLTWLLPVTTVYINIRESRRKNHSTSQICFTPWKTMRCQMGKCMSTQSTTDLCTRVVWTNICLLCMDNVHLQHKQKITLKWARDSREGSVPAILKSQMLKSKRRF